jgi:hypothetical protein
LDARNVTARAVTTAGEEHHEDDEDNEDGHDDPGHLDPAWHARRRSPIGSSCSGVVRAGRISHRCLLCHARLFMAWQFIETE